MSATNADKTITIYCRWTRPDGKVLSLRRVLKECSWEDTSISTALQTGKVLNESASIRIFCNTSGLTFLLPHEWYALKENELDDYWTADLQLKAKPLIVPHENEWQPESGTESDITKAENELLRTTPGALRVAKFNDNRKAQGSHIRLQA